MANWDKDITISQPSTRYKSTTTPPSWRVAGEDTILWKVVGLALPMSAEVELRFKSPKVVGTKVLTDNGTREIRAIVQNKDLKRDDKFCYRVWYVNGSTRYMMEDPELVMDGDTPISPARRKAAKKKAAKKKAAKKR